MRFVYLSGSVRDKEGQMHSGKEFAKTNEFSSTVIRLFNLRFYVVVQSMHNICIYMDEKAKFKTPDIYGSESVLKIGSSRKVEKIETTKNEKTCNFN